MRKLVKIAAGAGGLCVVLGVLAWPRFATFAARAKAAEARSLIGTIARLEIAYHSDKGTFGSLEAIGFKETPRRYAFAVERADAEGFRVVARQTRQGVLGGCDNGNDTWVVTETMHVEHTVDGFDSCTVMTTLVEPLLTR